MDEQKTLWRIGIWCAVSSKAQAGPDKESLPEQERLGRELAAAVGGEVVDGGMRLSQFGQVVSHYWTRIPDHVGHVELDEWVVMPNHIHGIVVITGRGEASPASASSTDNLTPGGTLLPDRDAARDASPLLQPVLQPGSLGAIVGSYKSVTTRRINRLRGNDGYHHCRLATDYWLLPTDICLLTSAHKGLTNPIWSSIIEA